MSYIPLKGSVDVENLASRCCPVTVLFFAQRSQAVADHHVACPSDQCQSRPTFNHDALQKGRFSLLASPAVALRSRFTGLLALTGCFSVLLVHWHLVPRFASGISWKTVARLPGFRGGVAESKIRRKSVRIALVRRWYESTTGIRTSTWIRNNPPATSPHPSQQVRSG